MLRADARIEQNDKTSAAAVGKDSGKSALAPPAEADLREARNFFADIIKKENLRLPDLKFDVVAQGSDEHKTYVLKEESKSGPITTTREMGRFQQDGAGNKSTMSREAIVQPDGSLVMHEIDMNVDAKSKVVTTKVFDGAFVERGTQHFQETSETVVKNGKEVSSATFEYSRQNGNLTGEKVVVHNPDGTTTSSRFEPADGNTLRPTSQTTTAKDGSELSSSKFSYAGNKTTETLTEHAAAGTTTTTVFEGSNGGDLKAKNMVVTDRNGKQLKSYVANEKGELIEKR